MLDWKIVTRTVLMRAPNPIITALSECQSQCTRRCMQEIRLEYLAAMQQAERRLHHRMHCKRNSPMRGRMVAVRLDELIQGGYPCVGWMQQWCHQHRIGRQQLLTVTVPTHKENRDADESLHSLQSFIACITNVSHGLIQAVRLNGFAYQITSEPFDMTRQFTCDIRNKIASAQSVRTDLEVLVQVRHAPVGI